MRSYKGSPQKRVILVDLQTSKASPVQGEVDFAQQNSEGLSVHIVGLMIQQNDRKTIPHPLRGSPRVAGEGLSTQ